MIFDANLMFDMGSYVAATGLTGVNVFTNGSSQASTNVLDMVNARDMGQAPTGPGGLSVFVLVTTAFAGGTSCNFQLQGSTDNSTYTTYAETGAIAVASLTAGTKVLNQMLPSVDPSTGATPRYYRMNYTCVGNVTAGAVIAGLAPTDSSHYYPPGVTVSN